MNKLLKKKRTKPTKRVAEVQILEAETETKEPREPEDTETPEAPNTTTSTSPTLQKDRKTIATRVKIIKDKLPKLAKTKVSEIVAITKTLKQDLVKVARKNEDNTKEEDTAALKKKYLVLLGQQPKSNLAIEAREFLKGLREQNLSNALGSKMPEVVESHVDISFAEEEISVNGGPFRLARGNWIQLDLGKKEKTDALKQALESLKEPSNKKLTKVSMLPSSFLFHLEAILEVLNLNTNGEEPLSAAEKKCLNQIKLLTWLCMAYLEILEEKGQEPPENLEDLNRMTHRPYKSPTSPIGFFKTILLNQAVEEEKPVGTPDIKDSEITLRVAQSISTKISTREAVELSCILAEREIESLKHSYKRESLFKIRAFLASKFFEKVKKHRGDQDCQADRLLSQKPRYKTPCVWLVVNRNNQRSEVIAVKPTTNVAYWGNPDSESERYSIIPINQPQSIWDSFDARAIKEGVIKHQTMITWLVVAFSMLSLSLGVFTELPKEERNYEKYNSIAEEAPGETQNNGLILTTNSSDEESMKKNLDIKEISPNNVGGEFNININSPQKKKVMANSNSVEW
jgi:hypothetical protein